MEVGQEVGWEQGIGAGQGRAGVRVGASDKSRVG